MKSLLLLPALACGVAAQQSDLPRLGNLANIAAVKMSDPGYKQCLEASEVLSGCVSDAGGTSGLSTAEPTEVVNCACCDGDRPLSSLYSSCSSYIYDNLPLARDQLSAFDDLYSACSLDSPCQTGHSDGSHTTPSVTSGSPAASLTATKTSSSTAAATDTTSRTQALTASVTTGGTQALTASVTTSGTQASATSTGAACNLQAGSIVGLAAAAIVAVAA